MRLKVLSTILIFLFALFNSYAQKSVLDSLIAVSKTAKADTSKALLLISITREATNKRKFDIANQYGKEALAFSEKLNYVRGINNSSYYLGYNYYKQNDNDNAIKYLSKSLNSYELAKNNVGIGLAAGSLGNTYYKMDMYPKALDYFLLTYKTYELLGQKLSMAGYAGNIGAIYNSMKQDEKALEFYFKSLKINEEIKSEQGKAINYVCIANVYNEQKKYTQALEYYEKALVINEQIGDKGYIANNLGNIGLLKINLKDYDGALKALNLALEKEKALNTNILSIATIERNIGDLYYQKKEYKEAEAHLKTSLELAEKISSLKLQEDLHLNLHYLYAATGQYELSLENLKKYMPLKDSLYGISNQKAILQKQMQFDFETKEAITKAEFIKSQSEKQLEIERRKQAIVQLEKDNALNQLSLTESNLKLKEKQVETETQKKQVELLNKDKLLQEAEAQKKAKELEQQKQLRNLFIGGVFLLLCFAAYILFNLSKSKKITKIIEKQKQEVEHQKHIVDEKQKEIVDSINYAQRIQYALLANKKLLDDNLPDYFLYFQPKDVVSGDFYWATSTGSASNGKFILVTADSTGHGVPGAIMSILNIACLNESIKADQLTEPADILNATREKIIHHLMHDGSSEGGKDGMDCSLVCFDFKGLKLTYAAANNPVWIVRENKLIALSADKMPIGKHDKDAIPFKQTEVELHKGDVIYTFTDGYADQFGGPKGKKYKYKQLEELLLSIHAKPMAIQHDVLRQSLNDWKGNLEQVDDVCVIGVRI